MLHKYSIALLALSALCTFAIQAQADTLDQIKKSGEIRLGYRTDVPPLTFNDASGQPAGYSVELCRRIAAGVKEHLKLSELKVTFVPLKKRQERMDAIADNKADIECGATTITLSRQQKVDFTLMTFVSGGGLMSLAGSGIDAVASLSGKSVAVVSGTTAETALKDHLTKHLIDAKVVAVSTREEALKQLAGKTGRGLRFRSGRADRAAHAGAGSEGLLQALPASCSRTNRTASS